jgi:fatty-acyl-CoA synthase
MAFSDGYSSTAHWFAEHDASLAEGSIPDLMRRNAAVRGDRPAIFWPGPDDAIDRFSHSELLRESERMARWLLDHAGPGDRIAAWSTNSIDYAVLLKASALAGTIIVPFNIGWSDGEAAHALALTEPALLVAGRDGRGGPVRPRAEVLASCPVVDLDGLLAREPSDPGRALPTVAASDPYLIQFTSGTTGRSKGALLSHRAAVTGGQMVMGAGDPSEHDVWLIPVPPHHIAGSCSIPLAALASGGAYVVVERFATELMIDLMPRVGATRMGGVPTMWHDLLRHPGFPEDVKVAVITLGGAKVPPALAREIEERIGATISISYGQSECGAITGTRADDDIDTKAETVGPPFPPCEVKIVDPKTGETVKLGEVGEMCTISPAAMIGYWGNPEATAGAFTPDGFLRTGDLASMDERGICRIHGRTGELIIRGGENIYPIEIEEALLRHPAVARVGVIGLPDARLGQKVAAAVELAAGASASIDELRAVVAAHVAHFKVPVEWRLVEALPMTASGKVRKVELPGLFAEETHK